LSRRAALAGLGLAALLSGAVAPVDAVGVDGSTPEDWIRNPAIGNYTAYAEFKMARYAQARQIWEVLASRGNGDALFNLGILAEDGLGEPRDMAKAEQLYVSAATAGNFKSQYRLGTLYLAGVLLPRDLDKARSFLSLAAAAGDREAASLLDTLDTPSANETPFARAERLAASGEPAAAARLYADLAEAGNVAAQTRLAWMFEAGRGVERSLDEAARLFQRSAEAGDAEAQFAISVMYRTGRGRARDDALADAWLERSAAQGYPPALAGSAGSLNLR